LAGALLCKEGVGVKGIVSDLHGAACRNRLWLDLGLVKSKNPYQVRDVDKVSIIIHSFSANAETLTWVCILEDWLSAKGRDLPRSLSEPWHISGHQVVSSEVFDCLRTLEDPTLFFKLLILWLNDGFVTQFNANMHM